MSISTGIHDRLTGWLLSCLVVPSTPRVTQCAKRKRGHTLMSASDKDQSRFPAIGVAPGSVNVNVVRDLIIYVFDTHARKPPTSPVI